jgi:hypothetical protein
MIQNTRLDLGQTITHRLLTIGFSGFWQTLECKERSWKNNSFVWEQNDDT